MSDEQFRELERRWAETGDVSEEAALLRARLRAGEASRRRVRLAAHLGHPPSLLALGHDPHRGEQLCEVLARFDPRIQVVAGAAALSVGLPLWREVYGREGALEGALLQVMELVTAWLEEPTDQPLPGPNRGTSNDLFFLFFCSDHVWVGHCAHWILEAMDPSVLPKGGWESPPELEQEVHAAMLHVLLPWCLLPRREG